jgi:hypothetical protein
LPSYQCSAEAAGPGFKSTAVYFEWLAQNRQRGGARGQMQKLSAGKFHFEPPSRFTLLDHLVSADQQRKFMVTPSVLAR